ncbi:MAG: vanadium-dependent haloperoxidase [Sediminibacterium sp.]|nr:vanadium-dependent haloperoxidase [Sediminibacterium sp.]
MQRKRIQKLIIFPLVLCVLYFISCKPVKNTSKEVFANPTLFNNAVFQLNWVFMGNNFSPIVASRNYAYASIAAYEVIVQGYPKEFNSLVGQLHGFEKIYKCPDTTLINFDYAALLAFCRVGEAVTFPEGSLHNYFDTLDLLAQNSGMPEEVQEATQQFADSIAKSIIAWSKLDNYAQTRTAEKYHVKLDSDWRWTPTPPGYFQATEPHWNEIRSFVLDNSNQFLPPPPLAFNIKNKNSPYYKEVQALIKTKENLTAEQKHIADFWDDNPFKLNVIGHVMYSNKKFSPPGHWMGIVGQACIQAKYDFPNTVYAYAFSAITMFDAFIQTWDAKYYYNTARPVTVINKFFDPNWEPYLQTPPFPEYTCGHSTISAAIAETLTQIFGDNFSFTDSTENPFGIAPRHFNSFRAAALENNLARYYGGIHFHSSCLVSTKMGIEVGQFIDNKLQFKINKKK